MDGVEFEIATEESVEGRRIAVRGDLDLATVRALRPALEAALEARTSIVLVLEECTFLDSSALKEIVDASRRAAEAKLGFAVARPSSQAARALEVSGLNEIVTIESDDYP